MEKMMRRVKALDIQPFMRTPQEFSFSDFFLARSWQMASRPCMISLYSSSVCSLSRFFSSFFSVVRARENLVRMMAMNTLRKLLRMVFCMKMGILLCTRSISVVTSGWKCMKNSQPANTMISGSIYLREGRRSQSIVKDSAYRSTTKQQIAASTKQLVSFTFTTSSKGSLQARSVSVMFSVSQQFTFCSMIFFRFFTFEKAYWLPPRSGCRVLSDSRKLLLKSSWEWILLMFMCSQTVGSLTRRWRRGRGAASSGGNGMRGRRVLATRRITMFYIIGIWVYNICATVEMIIDQVVWNVISHKHCSYRMKTDSQNFCRNEYNLTGLCNRRSCPLANSQYATVREEKGVCYLYMKTAERAHKPNELWEKVKLDKNYQTALEQLDEQLIYWSPFIIHKCKQRLTKLRHMLIQMRKMKMQGQEELVPIKKKAERRDRIREAKALIAANIEQKIEQELMERLKTGVYKDIYNYNPKAFEKVIRKERQEEGEEEGEVEEEEGMEFEEYVAGMESEEEMQEEQELDF